MLDPSTTTVRGIHTWGAYNTLLTNKSRPRPGDVVLTKDGSIGRVAVCDRDDICINQSVALLHPSSEIDSRFLAMLLQAPVYQRKMVADTGGSTIQHIYITRVDKMTIAVPELREQRAIAEVLGALDDKIGTSTFALFQGPRHLITESENERRDLAP